MRLGSPRWNVVYFLASFHLVDDVGSSVSARPPLSWINRILNRVKVPSVSV